MSFSVPVCHMCIKLSTECILNHIRMRTWKCMEFRCMFIEMKIRLVIFFIFLSVIELEFQMTGFLTCHFFIPFIRKLTQMLIETLFSWILVGFTEKRQTLFDLSLKNANIYKFYAFAIKTDFRNMSGSREFRRKN